MASFNHHIRCDWCPETTRKNRRTAKDAGWRVAFAVPTEEAVPVYDRNLYWDLCPDCSEREIKAKAQAVSYWEHLYEQARGQG